jgi:RNA-directed DNA polymerase
MNISSLLPSNNNLMAQIATEENLYGAWRKVRANHGAAGVDGVTLSRFEDDLPRHLTELAESLQNESYVPLPLRHTSIPKKDGKERELRIPIILDRVAQRAFVNVLDPIFEEKFLSCSFGYRPGRSVSDAVERVLAYRAAGLDWILDADVQDFFPSVDHAILLGQLREHIADRAVIRVIGLWLEAGALEVPLERPALLASVADRVKGAVQSLSSSDVAEEADWEEVKKQGRVKQLGSEVLRLAWDYRKTLLPFIATKAAVATGGAGLLVVGGVMAADYMLSKRKPRYVGTPQGGPISPLLSNIYLHAFDERVTQKGMRLVRYADDFVICCNSEFRAEHAKTVVAEELVRLRLTLHPEKTRILSCRDPLVFLGHAFDEDGAFPVPSEKNISEGQKKLIEVKQSLQQGNAVVGNKGKQVMGEGKKVVGEISERLREMKDGR